MTTRDSFRTCTSISYPRLRSIVVKSPLRLSTHSHVAANLLRVLELVLLQPTTCDLCQSFVPKLVPALFQAKSSDCTPECAKGSRSANGIQQLAPDLLDVLCSRESLHDGPVVNVETIRQLQEPITF